MYKAVVPAALSSTHCCCFLVGQTVSQSVIKDSQGSLSYLVSCVSKGYRYKYKGAQVRSPRAQLQQMMHAHAHTHGHNMQHGCCITHASTQVDDCC